MPKRPKKPTSDNAATPPPQTPESPILRLFPGYVHTAAERLQQGGLQGQVIDRQFAADEGPVLRFLETLHDSGEHAALTRLARLLRNYPLILIHPYIWGIIRNLYGGTWPSAKVNKASDEWLIELAKAWVEGITFGYQVSISNPGHGHRGRTPDLFPHLDDLVGWLPTQEATREMLDAVEFQRAYDDLMQHLQPCLAWRMVPRQYRQRRKDGLQTAHLLRDAAEKIAKAFEQFKRAWKIVRNPPSEEDLHEIVRAGLTVCQGGNPRHTIACGLLATLPWWNVQGQAIRLTPSLVESTLETLRKRGISHDKLLTVEPASLSSETSWHIEPTSA